MPQMRGGKDSQSLQSELQQIQNMWPSHLKGFPVSAKQVLFQLRQRWTEIIDTCESQRFWTGPFSSYYSLNSPFTYFHHLPLYSSSKLNTCFQCALPTHTRMKQPMSSSIELHISTHNWYCGTLHVCLFFFCFGPLGSNEGKSYCYIKQTFFFFFFFFFEKIMPSAFFVCVLSQF